MGEADEGGPLVPPPWPNSTPDSRLLGELPVYLPGWAGDQVSGHATSSIPLSRVAESAQATGGQWAGIIVGGHTQTHPSMQPSPTPRATSAKAGPVYTMQPLLPHSRIKSQFKMHLFHDDSGKLDLT